MFSKIVFYYLGNLGYITPAFNVLCPILGDLKLDLRPDHGRKLGG
jgi:hypothetical protein